MRIAVLVLLGCLGCRTSPTSESTRAPEPTATPPAEETMTYVSDTKATPAAAEADDSALMTDAAEAKQTAAVAGVAAKVETIAAARELATGAADEALGPMSQRLVSPALVPAWPQGKRALVFVVYPLVSSKAGINRFVVGAPIEVTVDLVEGTTAHRKLKKSSVLGEIEIGRDTATVRQNIETAEQTLLELLLERRAVDRSLVLLDGYREWFNHHLDVMTDLKHRMPRGIGWLREPQAR
jgi:hypothetical protein